MRAAKDAGLAVCETPPLLRDENAYACAAVAFETYQRGEYVTDTELSATYLRLPQAERERLERQAASEQP